MNRIPILVSIIILASNLRAATISVPSQYPTIQQAVDASLSGDTIVVHPGLYDETVLIDNKGITITGIDPDDPDVVESTVVQAGLGGSCFTIRNRKLQDTVITGLTIVDGTSGIACLEASAVISKNKIAWNQRLLDNLGAGILVCGQLWSVYASSPEYPQVLITGNLIEGNNSRGNKGAGIHCENAEATIVNNRIVANIGVGIYLYRTKTVVTQNLFTGATNARALQNEGNSASDTTVIAVNQFVGNLNTIDSVIHSNCYYGASALITENLIAANGAPPSKGTVISIVGGPSPQVICRNLILDNYSTAIKALAGPRIENNTIVNNDTYAVSAQGGGTLAGNLVSGSSISFSGSKPFSLTGNTLLGVCKLDGLADVKMLNNVVTRDGIWIRSSSSRLEVANSLVPGGMNSIQTIDNPIVVWGPNNIDADPLFVDPGHWDDAGTPDDTSDDTFILGDYHLLPGSPCIDAGTNDVDNPDTPEVETLPDTDLASIPRIIDGNLDGTATVDIGAYEYLPGDVNYDGRANILDLITIRANIGQDPASSLPARKADANADGRVNIEDLILVRGRLGNNQ